MIEGNTSRETHLQQTMLGIISLNLHECSLSGVDNHRWLEHTTQTLLAGKTILKQLCSLSASASTCSFKVVGTLNQIILFLHDIMTGGGGHQWGNMILPWLDIKYKC